MTFDFKKEFKELYRPKSIPHIVEVPKANYLAVIKQIIKLKDFLNMSFHH